MLYFALIIFFCILVCSYFIYSLVHGNNIRNTPISLYPCPSKLGIDVKDVDIGDIICSKNGEHYILSKEREFKIHIICNEYEEKLLELNYNFQILKTIKDLDDFGNIIELYEQMKDEIENDDIIFIVKNSKRLFNIITSFYSCEKGFYNKNLDVIGVRKCCFRRVFYLPLSGIGKKIYKIKSRIRLIGKTKIMCW